jgi:hypothetical protein
MSDLQVARETLYTVMRRCTDMIGAMTPDACEAFLGSYAFQAYEQDPAALTVLVRQMHTALDRLYS